MGMAMNEAEQDRTGNLGLKRIAGVGLLLGVLWGGLAPRAGGDIYWFQDEQGVLHISNVPVDPRFRFKEREEGDRRGGVTTAGTSRKSYDRLIDKIAQAEGLDPDLLRAVVEAESDFNPDAISRKGAVGLMQLMPETARRLGVSDPFHPSDNLEGGARYLRSLINKYEGILPLALSAYNAGENAVDQHKGIPPYPETRAYVQKVLTSYGRASKGRQGPGEPRGQAEPWGSSD